MVFEMFTRCSRIRSIGLCASVDNDVALELLMPSIFDLRMINYWEAAGLMILGRMLIGSFKGGHSHCGHGGWGHKHHGYWKRRWEDKMANMTPEEREKFKMGMSKCGDWGRWDNCEPDSPKSEHSKI